MDQVQVLSNICKKLNNDIEQLANQIGARESIINRLTASQHTRDEQFRQINVDIQMKLNKTDSAVQKLQSDIDQLSHGIREAINGQQELNRTQAQRQQELKGEVSLIELEKKKLKCQLN